MNHVVGLDLGQSNDYTAVAILEPAPPSSFDLRHLDRWRGVPYPNIVARVAALAARLHTRPALVVDATGVGAAVVDLFRASTIPADLIPVSIHGGDAVTQDPKTGAFRVPKRDLVATVAVLLESGRLRIAAALPHASTLVAELRNFRVKIDPATAHDSYAAWREADHDDLVLSVALASWYATRPGLPLLTEDSVTIGRSELGEAPPPWNSFDPWGL